MRRRAKVSYGVMACAGGAVAFGALGLASCVSSNNPPPPAGAEPDGDLFDQSLPDDTGPGADTGTDSGPRPPDATADTKVDAPTLLLDAGPDTADATPACAPGDVTAFVPPPYVHGRQPNLLCNDSDMNALARSCVGDASSYALCANYPNEALIWGTSAQCSACLLSPEVTLPQPVDAGDDASDDAAVDSAVPTYGAVIVTRVNVPNLPGCIEETDSTDAGLSCAMAMQAAWRCAEYACNPTCPVTDDPSEAAYFACAQQAAATVCKPYADPAAACLAAEADAGGFAYQACISGSLFSSQSPQPPPGPAQQFFDIASLFCAS